MLEFMGIVLGLVVIGLVIFESVDYYLYKTGKEFTDFNNEGRYL